MSAIELDNHAETYIWSGRPVEATLMLDDWFESASRLFPNWTVQHSAVVMPFCPAADRVLARLSR